MKNKQLGRPQKATRNDRACERFYLGRLGVKVYKIIADELGTTEDNVRHIIWRHGKKWLKKYNEKNPNK